jgi:hypothetical protein
LAKTWQYKRPEVRRFLSLGAGVQSTALLMMVVERDERIAPHVGGWPEAAIFADTQDEPKYVYKQLDRLREWAALRGFPIYVCSRGALGRDALNFKRHRFASAPFFTMLPDAPWVSAWKQEEGRLRRQCTREYKIEPMAQFIRGLLGYRPRQRIRERVEFWLGISTDEAHRVKESRIPWQTSIHPLVDARIRRYDCLRYVKERGLPEPQKSACYFCPFHDNDYWRFLRDSHPREWRRAVAFDKKVRTQTRWGVKAPVYLHRECIPLDEVDLSKPQMDLFGEECEGMCGV